MLVYLFTPKHASTLLIISKVKDEKSGSLFGSLILLSCGSLTLLAYTFKTTMMKCKWEVTKPAHTKDFCMWLWKPNFTSLLHLQNHNDEMQMRGNQTTPHKRLLYVVVCLPLSSLCQWRIQTAVNKGGQFSSGPLSLLTMEQWWSKALARLGGCGGSTPRKFWNLGLISWHLKPFPGSLKQFPEY